MNLWKLQIQDKEKDSIGNEKMKKGKKEKKEVFPYKRFSN